MGDKNAVSRHVLVSTKKMTATFSMERLLEHSHAFRVLLSDSTLEGGAEEEGFQVFCVETRPFLSLLSHAQQL